MTQAREYVTPMQCYNKIPYNAMKLNVGEQNLPMTYSLLKEDMQGAVLSVLKKAEDDDALIIRVYNPSETETIEGSVAFAKPVTEWTEVQLDEMPRPGAAEVEAGSFGTLAQCQAKTFKVKF